MQVQAPVEAQSDQIDDATADVPQDRDQGVLDDSLFDVDDLLGESGDELF